MLKVVVTGANGMLGQDLCPILAQEGFNVIRTDIDNLDITDTDQVKEVIESHNPDCIVHCAAYTNVDKAEEDVETAFLINKTGTENLAKVCGEKDITLIYISTDYVFNGESDKPYSVTDKRNPLGVYGESKAAGEIEVENYCKKYYITRTSWLYGHKGKNFVETMIALFEKMPELKVVNDQIGCPTWTVDLSKAILNLIKDNKPYGIYHLCGSGCTSWHGFASKALEFLGVDKKVNPCTTEEFPRPARRPKYSVMDNDGLLRDWKEALKDYMEMRG